MNLLRSLLPCLALLALVACDPQGAGASGVIELGAGLDPKDFVWLEIRAYPDDNDAFAADRIPLDGPVRVSRQLTEVSFPYSYEVGEGVGTTPEQHWRMTSWLSKEGGGRPKSGEPFCSVRFDVEPCGGQFGDFCGVSNDVNCTLE
jgi:hypothetical protein